MEKEKGSKRNSSLEDALSVQMDISSVAIFLQQKTHVPSGHLSFVWLCVSSIKRGTRRIMPPDELSFAILFERRTKTSSSFAWYKRRITRRTHSLQLCLVPRPHYYAPPVRFGSRGPREFRLRYDTEMNWPRRPGKTPYSDLATFNSPLSHSFSDVIICFGEF